MQAFSDAARLTIKSDKKSFPIVLIMAR